MTDHLGPVLGGKPAPPSAETAADRRKRRRARRRPGAPRGSRVTQGRWYTPYLFMLPGLVLFAIIFAWPVVLALQMSVSSYDIISPPTFVGLENFERLLVDPRFHHALTNSLLFLVLYTPLAVVVPLFLALLVNLKVPGIQSFRVAYFLPVVTSMVAVAVAWRFLLNQAGVVNWLLSLVGLGPVDFLLDTSWALPTVVAIEGWKNMGFYMMIYLAALQGIPREHLESATLDGASGLQRLRHIIVPALMPFFAVTLTLGMLEAMKNFETVYIMTRGGPQDATLTLGYYIWHLAFERSQMGYANTVGIFMWVLMIGFALLNLTVTRRKD
ncbi:carbohydrate ABC transporter permease [Ruania zhangjianzhongii]|uniref:carbohydrate ABC transporter permease n=1 Tax=Ruania zhangjianzhongii TaxID=2603206 RepID=UPI0011C85077|nr:sugar ABC transporter permease [Ruania zhangjianzhongii]